MIPSSHLFDQSTLAVLLDHDPLIQDYRAFFALLDWSVVEQWQARRSVYCGTHGHDIRAYLKTFLLRIRQGISTTSQLRTFLLQHPLLIIELGFRLHLDPTADYGFDLDKTLPTRQWLTQQLRSLDPALLGALLQATVRDLKDEIPGLGEVVAFDVKHIYAWVKENNLRVYVPNRYDKTRRPVGDPDCRFGVKKGSNQKKDPASLLPTDASEGAPQVENKERKESLWGYGSGVAAATTPDYGDVVLAEYTQPFNANDVTYFEPLYRQAALALGQFPTHLTTDAAFDAWYVYEKAIQHGGIAAVPLTQKSKTPLIRLPDGTPLCPAELPMTATLSFQHTYGYRAQRFQCPLLFPASTGQQCEHEQFVKGKGCVKDLNWERGGLQRVLLERESPLYQAIYTQCTSCERINSQAKELGIERPKVRNGQSVARLNTLTYVIINVRALQRAKSINTGLLQMN